MLPSITMEPQEELQQLLARQEALKEELKARKKELLEAQRLRKETLKRQIRRLMRSVDVDPDLAYEAAEESRRQAGENVIAAIGAQIAELRAENGEIRTEMKAGFTEVNARIEAQTSRIDVLQRVI